MLHGAQIAPRLMDQMLNELGDRSDRLPILQHALLRTWEDWEQHGKQGPLDTESYETVGTLEHALSAHANEALKECKKVEAAAKIFKCLTDTDVNHRRVRRPTSLSELAAVTGERPKTVAAVLDCFRKDGRNFLMISEGAVPGDQRVDISHESLIRQWDTLKKWVDQERDDRDQFLALVEGKRRNRALLQNPDRQIAQDWWDKTSPTEAWASRYCTQDDDFETAKKYLDDSQTEADKIESRNAWIKSLITWGVIIFAVILFVLSGFLYYFLGQAKQSAKEAQRSTREAKVNAKIANLNAQAAQKSTEEAQKALNKAVSATAILAKNNAYQKNQVSALVLVIEAMGLSSLLSEFPNEIQSPLLQTMQVERGTLMERTILTPHNGEVSAVAFSPTKQTLVSGSNDGKIRVWDYQGRLLGRPIDTYDQEVSAIAFSPDGQTIVSGGNDGAIRLWTKQGDALGPPHPSPSRQGVIRHL